MEVFEIAKAIRRAVIISKAEPDDFRCLTKRRFSFDWQKIRSSATVYKLQIAGDIGILGVIGLIDWPEEKRIEIKLLASAAENIGRNKVYGRVAGCLIAFACRRAVAKFNLEACVSLVPKTELVRHYKEKYYMFSAGRQLCLEGANLFKLLNEYL